MAKILVIDDDDAVRRMLTSALTGQGHEVVVASNGKEALAIQAEVAPDLVITDILMPETDGIEVILALRRSAPDLRVIAMSGGGRFQQKEVLDIAVPLGAVAALRKPFTIVAMLETVQRALAA